MSDDFAKWIIVTLLSLAVGGLYSIAGGIGEIKAEVESTRLYAENIKSGVDLIIVQNKYRCIHE